MDVGKEVMQRVDVTEGNAWDIERYVGKGKGRSQMKKKIQWDVKMKKNIIFTGNMKQVVNVWFARL